MSFRTPIVAYEESGHAVKIFSAQPCVFAEVDGVELGPFYENMAAARKMITRHIEEKEAEKTKATVKKGKKRE